jgi:diguanylate cyclase (GGDEF)-like protein
VSAKSPRLSLLQLLTLPFLAAILLLGVVVLGLGYRAADAAAQELALHRLGATVQRIGDGLERRRSEADAVLRAAFPQGSGAPADPAADLNGLAHRAWAALSMHPQPQAALSFVALSGQSILVRRLSATDAALSWQRSASAPIETRLFQGASGTLPQAQTGLPAASAEAQGMPADARESPWFRIGRVASAAVWLPAAIDPATAGLTQTRVRRVLDGEGKAVGVAATDVPLKPLEDLLRDLPVSPRALVLVVERSGRLVALRGAPVLRGENDGGPQRLSVHEAAPPGASALYQQLLPRLAGATVSRPGFARVELPDGELMFASFASVGDGGEQPWAIIAAAPGRDFTAGMPAYMARMAAAALAAAAFVLVAGAWIKRRITRDALELARTAERVGDGDLDTPPGEMASRELEGLRDSLRRMQLRLRTDRITGLANREAVLNRLHERMRAGRRRNDAPLLALLFVDLDRFKLVNDHHGHDVGDFVLQTIGRRLRQTVRDTDMVARWSGDEFVLLLDGVDSRDNAQRVRDQVERVLRDPVELGPGRDGVELDGTVGLALSAADAFEPDLLIRAAEADMAQRKPQSPGYPRA